MSFIYLIQNLETSKYKIGISKNPNKRIKQLQTGSGEELKLIHTFETSNARTIELTLHNIYLLQKTHGEWFNLSIVEEIKFLEECKKIDNNINILKNLDNKFI